MSPAAGALFFESRRGCAWGDDGKLDVLQAAWFHW